MITNDKGEVRFDVEVAADTADAKAKSGLNWLGARLQKRAVGRKHKPGRDYVAEKAVLTARDAELESQQAEEITSKSESSVTASELVAPETLQKQEEQNNVNAEQ